MVLQASKKPEEAAREDIDKMLELSGWFVQNKDEINLSEGIGIAVTEKQKKLLIFTEN
jgi:type I restriction enzyme, R subunit